jgi:hypothetical protein
MLSVCTQAVQLPCITQTTDNIVVIPGPSHLVLGIAYHNLHDHTLCVTHVMHESHTSTMRPVVTHRGTHMHIHNVDVMHMRSAAAIMQQQQAADPRACTRSQRLTHVHPKPTRTLVAGRQPPTRRPYLQVWVAAHLPQLNCVTQQTPYPDTTSRHDATHEIDQGAIARCRQGATDNAQLRIQQRFIMRMPAAICQLLPVQSAAVNSITPPSSGPCSPATAPPALADVPAPTRFHSS